MPVAAPGRRATAARRVCASTARTALASPSVGTQQAAEHHVGVEQRVLRGRLGGVEQVRLDAPRRSASPCRRCDLGERAPGWWRPPGRRPEGSTARRRPRGRRASRRCSGPARSSSWTRWPGTPARGRATRSRRARAAAPWSTTVTSSQPRAESSSASAAPTTPAPMMTTRGPVMPTSIVAPDATRCVLRNNRLRPPRWCQEVPNGSPRRHRRHRRHQTAPDSAVRGRARPGSGTAPGSGTRGFGQRVRTARP